MDDGLLFRLHVFEIQQVIAQCVCVCSGVSRLFMSLLGGLCVPLWVIFTYTGFHSFML